MFTHDLHNHSHFSDGECSPDALMAYAKNQGVELMALTDHDTVAGIFDARVAARKYQLDFIAGIEISAQWEGHDLHILGLNINENDAYLQEQLAQQNQRRISRAKQIANQLRQQGIKEPYEGALALAGSAVLTRPHFAKYLVNQGYVQDMKQAFKRYLTKGAPAYVPTSWPTLQQSIEWINSAGGSAVLAHPKRYKLTNGRLRKCIAAFKACGGEGLEIVTFSHKLGDIEHLTQLALQFDLLASQGGDFHGPGYGHTYNRKDLQTYLKIPAKLTPIWHNWSF